MQKELSPAGEAAERRRRAEERLRAQQPKGDPAWTSADTQRLVHELQVHQIELELQNEELQQANDTVKAGLEKVIRNIVLNAREAMPGGGRISVRAENLVLKSDDKPSLPPGDYVRVAIADQGGGIAQDVLQKIFDPYFSTKQRGDQNAAQDGPGREGHRHERARQRSRDASVLFTKYVDLRGEGFWRRARIEEGEYPQRSLTDERQSPALKGPPPNGLRRKGTGSFVAPPSQSSVAMLPRRASLPVLLGATKAHVFREQQTRARALRIHGRPAKTLWRRSSAGNPFAGAGACRS